VGVFRQGAAEAERLVTIRGLDPAAEYVVRRGPDGGEVARLDGRALAETGFRVRLSERYDGTLLEVARSPAR
jgi:hypothetical protein